MGNWSLRTDHSFFAQSRRLGSRAFTLYTLPFSSFEAVVIVPKSVCKLATERNKLKRRLRAILTKIKQEKHHSPQKIVLSARPSAKDMTFSELETAVRAIVSKT